MRELLLASFPRPADVPVLDRDRPRPRLGEFDAQGRPWRPPGKQAVLLQISQAVDEPLAWKSGAVDQQREVDLPPAVESIGVDVPEERADEPTERGVARGFGEPPYPVRRLQKPQMSLQPPARYVEPDSLPDEHFDGRANLRPPQPRQPLDCLLVNVHGPLGKRA